MLEFSRCLNLCNHISESIHSWTKGTYPTLNLPHPTPPTHPFSTPTTLPYPTATFPCPFYPTHPTLRLPLSYPYPTHTLLPYPTLPHPYPPTHTLPTTILPLPYPLRIQTHAHIKPSQSQLSYAVMRQLLFFKQSADRF